jgi:hypothetical protein
MKESRVDSVDTSVFKQDKVLEVKPKLKPYVKITKILKKGEKVLDNTYKPPHKRVEEAPTLNNTADVSEKGTSKAPTNRPFDKNIPLSHSELLEKRTDSSKCHRKCDRAIHWHKELTVVDLCSGLVPHILSVPV